MSTNDSSNTSPDAPHPELFRTTNMHLTATLGCCGHKGCQVYADYVGRCSYEWPDSEALRRDVQAFDNGTDRPGGWPHPKKLFQAVKTLRDVMDLSISQAKEAAAGDPDFAVFEWRQREAERARITAQPTQWTRNRQFQAAAEAKARAQAIEKHQRDARRWRIHPNDATGEA